MSNVTQLRDPQKDWDQVKERVEEAEEHAFSAVHAYCDVGDMLRQLRATMTVENFTERVRESLCKGDDWARMVMKLSFYRTVALNHDSFRQAYEAVKVLPQSEEEKTEKKSWPSNQGKGGGRPKKKAAPKPAEPKPIGWKQLLLREFLLITDGQMRNPGIVEQIKAGMGEDIPPKILEDSAIADKLREVFTPIYEDKFKDAVEEEEAHTLEEVNPQNLSDKQKLDKALELYKKKLKREFDYEVNSKVYDYVQENIAHLHEKVNKLIKDIDTSKPVFSDKEFKAIRGCLHSDRIPDDMKAKYEKAFNLLEQKKERLCGLKKATLEGVSGIPRTAEELLKRRKKKF